MSRILQTILMVVLAVAGFTMPTAAADTIGLYTDITGARTSVNVAAGEEFTVYLMLAAPSDPSGVQGWECRIEVPDNVIVSEWQLAGRAINFFSPPEFMVGLESRLPADEMVLLATARCIARDVSSGLFRILANPRASVSPPAPCYATSNTSSKTTLTSLKPASAGNDGVVFGVNTDDQQIGLPILPQKLSLHPNSPNPFNPMTTLRFDLPAKTPVNLTIFTLTGRRVATLVDEIMPAGSHDITWTGRDDNGRSVSSGTYVYRIQATERTITRKMTIVR